MTHREVTSSLYKHLSSCLNIEHVCAVCFCIYAYTHTRIHIYICIYGDIYIDIQTFTVFRQHIFTSARPPARYTVDKLVIKAGGNKAARSALTALFIKYTFKQHSTAIRWHQST